MRKLEVFSFIEGFFEMYGGITESEKDKNSVENSNFLENEKNINRFNQPCL